MYSLSHNSQIEVFLYTYFTDMFLLLVCGIFAHSLSYLSVTFCRHTSGTIPSQQLVGHGLDDQIIGDRFPTWIKTFPIATVSKLALAPLSFLFNGFWRFFPEDKAAEECK
jgi:hypothetical protein